MTGKAIDYLVCPFTPELLRRHTIAHEAPAKGESTPIKFPTSFMAGLTVPEYIAFMDENGIEKSLIASVKFGTIFDAPSR